MITGFEEYTHELTDYEKTLVDPIVSGLKKRTSKEMAVKNHQIVAGMKKAGHAKITPERIRKIINVIRRSGMIELLIATSKGYYISSESSEIENYIKSLKEREESIKAMRLSIEKQHNKIK